MRSLVQRRWWWMGAALAVGAGVCLAQTQAAPQSTQEPAQRTGSCTMTDENGKVISLPECANVSSTPKAETPQSKSAAQKFPYPGDSGGDSGGDSPDMPSSAGSSAGQGAGGQAGGTSASKRFPFPGDAPEASQTGAAGQGSTGAGQGAGQGAGPGAGPLRDAGSSGESSSSSSSSSSSADPDAMKDLGPDHENENPYKADDEAARARAASRRSKREAPAAKPQTADERVAEDLQVASFYRDGGNWRGAYLRAKDAVATEGDDPESHFLLAEAARKLGKLDEAQAEYKATLAHDPIPKTKKAAEKALREMAGGS